MKQWRLDWQEQKWDNQNCMAHNSVDLTGQVFGRLTVKSLGPSLRDKRRWLCECSCGGAALVMTSNLRRGNTKSCGCFHADQVVKSGEKHVTHGKSYTPLYVVWRGMMQRCYNPKAVNYDRYGGRGITVCERWHSVGNFILDMPPRPSEHHTLERVKNEEGYSPSNCRWATNKEQSRNRRNNRFMVFEGKRFSLVEWAEITGINAKAISHRLCLGWSIERTLTTPLYGTT
jgi:hypothetical protein